MSEPFDVRPPRTEHRRPARIAAARVPFALAAVACALSCSVPPAGADAHEITVESPATWHGAEDDLHRAEARPAGGAAAATDSDGQTTTDERSVPASWWTGLGDETLDARLDALVDRALEHNRDLRAASARIGAAVAQARIAGADLLPRVDAQANGQRTRQVFVGIPIPGTGGVFSNINNQFGVSLNLSWELDLWGRIRAANSAARADIVAVAADWVAARESLAAQTVRAFFAAVEANLQLQLAERTADSFARTAEQVRSRFERGTRPALDLRLAMGNVASARANARQRHEQLERARRQLELLLGSYPFGRDIENGATLPEDLPPVPVGLPSELLARRPDIVAAERRLAAADDRLTEARRALLPRISLTASGGTTSNKLEDLLDEDFLVWNIAGNLLQPIFEGGRLRAQVDQSDARVREALAQWEQAVLTAFTDVETALASERKAIDRVAALRDLVTQQSAALELADARYRRGLVDFLTVADAQRAALDAESRWLTARRAMLDVRIDLHLALGGAFDAPPTDPDHAAEAARTTDSATSAPPR